MKKVIFLVSAILFTISFSVVSAQSGGCCNKSYSKSSCNKNKSKESFNSTKGEKETTFKVAGNCGMCEARIEKAALNVKDVKSAEWNKETKMLKITYTGNVNKEEVQKSIAAAGHDTGKFKAKDAVYNALPGCCKYR
ncbi:MAG: heavy-metal-associated domain-containing protein [Bacteroidales bacterium]|nr:heavy-metal-associated domain-containing protein [Bacteroidales bacterium]